MSQPDFATLEALPGNPNVRLVAGTWMDREEYEVCGWHLATIPGDSQPYWMARLAGLQEFGRRMRDRRQQRHVAWQERNGEDDSFREYVDALDDAKPTR